MGATDESYPPDATNIASRVADVGFYFFASGCVTMSDLGWEWRRGNCSL